MKLTNLRKASDYKVKNWLVKELELTSYQQSKMYDQQIIRWAPFEFYEKRPKQEFSPLWRVSIIFYPVYMLLLFLFLPIMWMFTGRWGYSRKFYDGFHSAWTRRLGL